MYLTMLTGDAIIIGAAGATICYESSFPENFYCSSWTNTDSNAWYLAILQMSE